MFALVALALSASEMEECNFSCDEQVPSGGKAVCMFNTKDGNACFEQYDSCADWQKEKCNDESKSDFQQFIIDFCEMENFRCPKDK